MRPLVEDRRSLTTDTLPDIDSPPTSPRLRRLLSTQAPAEAVIRTPATAPIAITEPVHPPRHVREEKHAKEGSHPRLHVGHEEVGRL